jgi:hypothetical protein
MFSARGLLPLAAAGLLAFTASTAKAQTNAQLADAYAGYAYQYAYVEYASLLDIYDGTTGIGLVDAQNAYLDTYYGTTYAQEGDGFSDPYFFSLAIPYLYDAYTTEYQVYVYTGDEAAYDAFYYSYCAYYYSYLAYYYG